MPHLLRERPIGLQVVLAGLVPAAFGAICGYLLGVNEVAYLVLSILAIGGGYGAGLEHDGARGGALRGVVGGTLFGGFILLVHEATGEEAKAELPEPEILLLVLTIGFGILLGTLGGRARHKRELEGPKEKEARPPIDLKLLKWPEYLGFLGVGVLLGALFLPWYTTSCDTKGPPASPSGCNTNSVLNGRRGDLTAFETFKIMDILLVAACIAPFVLAYLVVRSTQLSWRPGEITMIVGMVAAALIWLNGIVLGRPGDSVDIGLGMGYWVGLVGANLILAGGLIRQSMGGFTRKPPGVM
jgi:hypothetical protein